MLHLRHSPRRGRFRFIIFVGLLAPLRIATWFWFYGVHLPKFIPLRIARVLRDNFSGGMKGFIEQGRKDADKPFFAGLIEFITSGPLVAMAVEGPTAIEICRAINGATRPHEAAPGSIRGDFALETGMNIVHASDSTETATAELALWFADAELFDYERAIDAWIVE